MLFHLSVLLSLLVHATSVIPYSFNSMQWRQHVKQSAHLINAFVALLQSWILVGLHKYCVYHWFMLLCHCIDEWGLIQCQIGEPFYITVHIYSWAKQFILMCIFVGASVGQTHPQHRHIVRTDACRIHVNI